MFLKLDRLNVDRINKNKNGVVITDSVKKGV